MKFKIDIGYKNNLLYKDVEIYFPENGVVSIIGDNGSGKSTLHKTLLGSIPPLRGTVPEDFFKRCAVVSDYVHIPENVTVLDVLDLIDKIHIKIAQNRYAQMAEYIKNIENQIIRTLSSGQKRIVEIYVALASGKDIILLDEAANALDFKNRNLFLEQVKRLSLENVLFVHTSHDLSDIEYLEGEVYGFFKNQHRILRYTDSDLSVKKLKSFLGYEVLK